MKLSLEWLSDFVDIDVSPGAYAEAMTLSGSKVEAVVAHGAGIERVVVGRVEAIERHPDADKLSVCRVDVSGDKPLTIVTGASNVVAGDLVPVALDGARLPDGREIRAGTLRGALSEGMLCSLAELGLTAADFPGAPEDGIMVLPREAEAEAEPESVSSPAPGQDIRDILGLRGHTVEFEITNNRPDCLSVIGLAREGAAVFQKPLTLKAPDVKGGGGAIQDLLTVRVDDPELCLRYTARMVKDVKIAPSPNWLRRRLRASGVRPINNIVDITNYVMLEYGQPMHAFDYARVGGATITARRARSGESLLTLDGRERSLTPDMLIIADDAHPLAVAGVMGGADSEITPGTRDIVLESANFYGPSVRLTALALAMRTESSNRFEKKLDPYNTVPAVDRACALIERLGAGTVCDGIIDVYPAEKQGRVLPVDAGRINALLGTRLPDEEIYALLSRLGFARCGDGVKVPSWRDDVEGMADLAEEAARLYGYNNIASAGLPGAARGGLTEGQRLRVLAREVCRALGYHEILTYSFVGASWFDKLCYSADDPRRDAVVIQNPLGEETSLMRPVALPSLLDALASNEAARNKDVRLFELAMTYRPRGGGQLPDERPMLVLGGYGHMDFFDLKGAVEDFLRALQVEGYAFAAHRDSAYHPGRCAALRVDGQVAGMLGEIHPDVARAFGSEQRLYACELDFLSLQASCARNKLYRPLPRFPSLTRDLAVVCRVEVPASALEEAIRRGAGPLLVDCRLFDVYVGSQIADGEKSVAFTLTLQANDRTLTDQDADIAVEGALAELASRCGASLR
ncbi:MAG: phenylalanine--tRNA ligase subunit beta [Oscillospiraceae bacterium]|nr:phenylalanine--tRNA ligase subunit beta [Oscillospiraceae bacterium]